MEGREFEGSLAFAGTPALEPSAGAETDCLRTLRALWLWQQMFLDRGYKFRDALAFKAS